MEQKGRIKAITPIDSRTDKNGKEWQSQTVVIEWSESSQDGRTFPKILAATTIKVAILENLQVGQEVTLYFNVESREWQGRYFTEAKLWKVDAVAPQTQPQYGAPQYGAPQYGG